MKHILLFFILSIAFMGCEEIIDWEVDSDEIRLVVEGRITNEMKVHQIKLTETADYFDPQEPKPVRAAVVRVFDGNKTIEFKENSPGIYESAPFAGEVGRTYDLSITLAAPLANETSFAATSTLLKPASLDSLSAINKVDEEESDDGFQFFYTDLRFWGTGNLSEENSYLLEVYINGLLETDAIEEAAVFKDEFVSEEFEGFPFAPFTSLIANDGDSIALVIHSVENGFADFHEQLLLESEPRDPFGLSSPPANVSTNISGGALGYFYVSAVDTVRTIARDDF